MEASFLFSDIDLFARSINHHSSKGDSHFFICLFAAAQVELQLERGKLPLAEYAVKEAKLLAYKLVEDCDQLAEEGNIFCAVAPSISSVSILREAKLLI